MSPSEAAIDAAIDAGYRSLAAAIVLQAVRDTANPRLSQEANHFLTSPLCKSLLRLSGIHWTATSTDFPRAALRLQGRRMRHQAGSARSSIKTACFPDGPSADAGIHRNGLVRT